LSFFSAYLFAIGIFIFSIVIMPKVIFAQLNFHHIISLFQIKVFFLLKRLLADLDLWAVIISSSASILISLSALTFILINLIRVSGKLKKIQIYFQPKNIKTSKNSLHRQPFGPKAFPFKFIISQIERISNKIFVP